MANRRQWDQIIASATQNSAILEDAEANKIIRNILKTNVAACSSIGSYFYPQIGRIYMDMLQMYRATSQMISEAVEREGTRRAALPTANAADGTQAPSRPRCPKCAACAPSRRRS